MAIMEDILDEIKKLRRDLNINTSKIVYLTIEMVWGDWDFKTTKVYKNPEDIPYILDEYDEYVRASDLVALPEGGVIEGRKFQIRKLKIV